jgi:hypothetical protein
VATSITPERVDELLRFLPLFEQAGRAFVESWSGDERTSDGAATAPFAVYASDVEEFFSLAGQPCWCDREYVPAEAATMLEDDNLVQIATIDQLRTMLTYCVRGERFCDGHWESVLRSGRVVSLLRRLKVLRRKM